jgi:hypothetical protein
MQIHLEKLEIGSRLKRCFDLRCAFVDEIGPNPPSTFTLLESDNRSGSALAPATEMQDHVITRPFCISEVIEIYDAAVR